MKRIAVSLVVGFGLVGCAVSTEAPTQGSTEPVATPQDTSPLIATPATPARAATSDDARTLTPDLPRASGGHVPAPYEDEASARAFTWQSYRKAYQETTMSPAGAFEMTTEVKVTCGFFCCDAGSYQCCWWFGADARCG